MKYGPHPNDIEKATFMAVSAAFCASCTDINATARSSRRSYHAKKSINVNYEEEQVLIYNCNLIYLELFQIAFNRLFRCYCASGCRLLPHHTSLRYVPYKPTRPIVIKRWGNIKWSKYILQSEIRTFIWFGWRGIDKTSFCGYPANIIPQFHPHDLH